ncbi:retrovirus-related Pol polyprotein from transposon TNT 1-94 [Trichonephila clavipes]|nr:retrovirus-related Pol polyprotein from transposon TNT 1-94 [Trichonephila clavipes]
MGRTILLERRQRESVGRRNSRTTFLRSDWPRPFARREVGVEMELADGQALQFTAEDNAKVLWDKIIATFIGRGEDRKIDVGNELKKIVMENGETAGDYIARARGISTKCHSLGLNVPPRELVYHTVGGLNGKFSKVRDILKTQREKTMEEVLQILRDEETTFNLPIKTRMDGINAEAFYSRRKNGKQTRLCCICRKQNHQAKDCYYRNKNSPTEYENLTDKRIKKIRTDNGLEFVNEQLSTYLANSGIFHEKTIPYNSESKSKAETANRVLLERAKSLLYETTSSPQTGKIQLPVLELNDVQNQIPVRRSERLKSKQMSVHLTNNVPNSYFEAKNRANWQNWKLAMENELDSLDKHKVWEIVQKPAKSKLIKTLNGYIVKTR